MSFILRFFLLSSVSALIGVPAFAEEEATRPQHVVISFDGALPLAQWKRSRALADATGARFTYFVSCVYLLSRDKRGDYQGPGMEAGRSNVGFGSSPQDVAARLDQIWSARGDGHEIASHGCGHFDGADWSAKDWTAEFAEFSRILGDAFTINGLEGEPSGWADFARHAVTGFRAPYLATGDGLFAALAENGFRYDSSTVSNGPAEPMTEGGVVRFSLPMIPEGPQQRPVIAMDYNLFVRHSGGAERPDPDGAFEERTFEAFMQAFETQYAGERIPLQIGYHFTLMNGGAYWRALERFAEAVCTRPQVRCVTYRELAGTVSPS